MNANRVIRIEAQRTDAGPMRTKILWFGGRYVIRVAAMTLASDSVITIARFRPSKMRKWPPHVDRDPHPQKYLHRLSVHCP